jgi:hypothetical protein
MKTRLIVALALVAILGSAAYVSADAAANPQKGVIVGDAVELSTLAMQGMGEGSGEAMVSRCEQGFPVGIVEEETGKVWVCVYRNNAPASSLETANAAMQQFMGKKVAAQGLKYETKGLNVLRLSVISEY